MAGHVARMEEGRTSFKILTDTTTGRRLHNEELHSLYRSHNIVNEFSQTSLKGQGLLLLEQGIARVCSLGELVL